MAVEKSVNLIVRSFLILRRSARTSGTNDKVKGCAGPITRARPLFWSLEKSPIRLTANHQEEPFVHPPSFRNSLCRWTRELNSWQQKESRLFPQDNWPSVFPAEDQLFVPLRCISIHSPFLILPLVLPLYPPLHSWNPFFSLRGFRPLYPRVALFSVSYFSLPRNSQHVSRGGAKLSWKQSTLFRIKK